MNNDLSDDLVTQVVQAYTENTPLVITAGGSKAFYGNAVEGSVLDVTSHTGIIEYQPSELVITARSGTPLVELEDALQQNNQQLAFEPPQHTDQATIGGAIACGLSGPARPFQGAARDFVLGAKIINGKGELMQFGGQVMKNVAGYDLSRLMVGAQGTLGVLLELSLKVLPEAEAETTLVFDSDAVEAHKMLRGWLSEGHPVTASCHFQGVLSVRLGSTENSIREAHRKMGGDIASNDLWQLLRHQSHPCFQQDDLWRLSLPPVAAIHNEDDQLIEWGGALRWKVSNNDLFEQAQRLGGHATRYNMKSSPGKSNPAKTDLPVQIFQPLQAGMLAIHKRIKHALDPNNILNPARLYKEL